MIVKERKIYTVSEVCNILGIFKNTLYNWEKQRKIPKAKRDPMSKWRIYTKEDVYELRRITQR